MKIRVTLNGMGGELDAVVIDTATLKADAAGGQDLMLSDIAAAVKAESNDWVICPGDIITIIEID